MTSRWGCCGRLIFFLLVACRGDPAEPLTPDGTTGKRYVLSATPTTNESVIARVNGRPIYAADLVWQWRLDRHQALTNLIHMELLAQVAEQQGHSVDPWVQEVSKRERVRRFIVREFLPHADGPEDVPSEELEEMWQKPDVKEYFQHPEFREVGYVRVPLSKDAGATEAERAETVAKAIYDLAKSRHLNNHEAWVSLAKTVADKAQHPLQEGTFTTARHGPAVEVFAQAAFLIEKTDGLSPPTRTPWGWDILRLQAVIPARHASREQAFSELREQLFPIWQRRAFLQWSDGWIKRTQVTKAEHLLEKVTVNFPIE